MSAALPPSLFFLVGDLVLTLVLVRFDCNVISRIEASSTSLLVANLDCQVCVWGVGVGAGLDNNYMVRLSSN